MSNPEQKQSFLFAGLAPGREGAQCAFSVRALSYIFHGWAHYKGERKQIYSEPDKGVLTIIPFEKLGLFWCRLWEQLWKLNGARDPKASDAPNSSPGSQERISCPPPFMVERAKHGKRPQRYNGVDAPIPLADILYQQQEFGIRVFFDIRPHIVGGKVCPNHHKTEVHATIPYEIRGSLIKDFDVADRKCVEEIDEIVRHLGASEIRALGTHESLNETMRDIEWEFDNMKPFVAQVVAKINDSKPFIDDAQEVLEFADEAYRKSYANRADYAGAHKRFMSDIKSPLLKEAFEKCQDSEAAIWDQTQIEALAKTSDQVLSIAKCLTAIAYFAGHPEERKQARATEAKAMAHHWNEGLNGLKKHKILTIPSDLTAFYEGDSQMLKLEARMLLLELVGRLQT